MLDYSKFNMNLHSYTTKMKKKASSYPFLIPQCYIHPPFPSIVWFSLKDYS